MARFDGTSGNDTYRGTRSDDTIVGLGGRDHLHGGGGDDHIYGGDGNDWLAGGTGSDYLDGGAGYDYLSYEDLAASVSIDLATGRAYDSSGATDTFTSIEGVYGSQLNDEIYGDGGRNVLSGNGGNDFLYGRAGNDTLSGGDGNDFLTGGSGVDVLTGGNANDTFIFGPGDIGSTAATADRITDFGNASDLIDLSAIDANLRQSGDQAFDFLGTGAFTGHAGELRYEVVSGVTWLVADVDGDKVADGYLRLDGVHAIQAHDLVL